MKSLFLKSRTDFFLFAEVCTESLAFNGRKEVSKPTKRHFLKMELSGSVVNIKKRRGPRREP